MQLIAGFSLFAYYIFLFFPILLKAAIFTKGRWIHLPLFPGTLSRTLGLSLEICGRNVPGCSYKALVASSVPHITRTWKKTVDKEDEQWAMHVWWKGHLFPYTGLQNYQVSSMLLLHCLQKKMLLHAREPYKQSVKNKSWRCSQHIGSICQIFWSCNKIWLSTGIILVKATDIKKLKIIFEITSTC